MAHADAVGRTGGSRATGLLLFAMLAFALQDLAVKIVAESVSIWQMLAIRSAAVVVLLALTARLAGQGEALLPRRWGWPVVRALLIMGAYLAFYAALPFLSLSQAAAGFFVGPLLITVFAALLLGEPIGPRRILAVLVGFLGVLVIVRPGLSGWQPVALLPVAAAAFYAMGMVMTRWRCADEPAPSLTMTLNLVYTGVGIVALAWLTLVPAGGEARAAWPFLAEGWLPLGATALALLLATAVSHMAGMLASVAAYRQAEASRIAPFEYAYLAIVPVIDLVVFGAPPDALTLVGMGLIVGAGSFVAWREGRPARARIATHGETPWSEDNAAEAPPARRRIPVPVAALSRAWRRRAPRARR